MFQQLKFPRACRCCLSTDRGALFLMKEQTHILEFLVGEELNLTELWLCYFCSHTLKKICHFRDICYRSHAVLQEYSNIQDSNLARNYFRREKKIFSQGRESEPSMSNTLCMSIMIDDLVSPIYVESFNRNGKLPKNYTDNVTRYYETVFEDRAVLDSANSPNCFEFAHPVNDDSDIILPNVKKECASDCDQEVKYLPFNESIIKKEVLDLSVGSPTNIECYKEEVGIQNPCDSTNISVDSSTKKILKENSNTKPSPKKKSKAKKTLEKNDIRVKLPDHIAEEIDKISSTPLTLQEQMKEKEDRTLEDSYVRAAYKCEFCVVTFKTKLAMENHQKRHLESNGSYICPICTLRYHKPDHLKHHSAFHSFRLACRLCEKRYYSKKALAQHLLWHSGNTICFKCGKKFTDREEFKEHVKLEHPAREFKCETCHKALATKPLYQMHMQRHSGIPTHLCPICSKGFYSEINLNLHIESHKEKVPDKNYCVECDRHFKTIQSLNYHFKYSVPHRSPSILNFKCPDCPMAFHNNPNLIQHTAAQHGGKPKYECNECGAHFASRAGLVKHMVNVHLGLPKPKRFSCPFCKRAFTIKAVLQNHIRTHTGEKPFECPQCSDCFNQKSTLSTHIKLVHLKIKARSSMPDKKIKARSSLPDKKIKARTRMPCKEIKA